MDRIIPELVRKSAEAALEGFCAEPVSRAGQDYVVGYVADEDGYELSVTATGATGSVPLARLNYTFEISQWTLHRSLPGGVWSFVPEAGCALDLNRLLRYIRHDPLNIFW